MQTFRKYLFLTHSGPSETSADGLMGNGGGSGSDPDLSM